MKKNDKIREKFTQEYSGKSRYDARNYDLSIDVEKATVEQTIKLLESIVKIKL